MCHVVCIITCTRKSLASDFFGLFDSILRQEKNVRYKCNCVGNELWMPASWSRCVRVHDPYGAMLSVIYFWSELTSQLATFHPTMLWVGLVHWSILYAKLSASLARSSIRGGSRSLRNGVYVEVRWDAQRLRWRTPTALTRCTRGYGARNRDSMLRRSFRRSVDLKSWELNSSKSCPR